MHENLYSIFSEFGEERYSKNIAKKIIENRPINKTIELSNIIRNSVPKQNPIFIEKSIPTYVATPFPPLNFNQIGKRCPKNAHKEAIYIKFG